MRRILLLLLLSIPLEGIWAQSGLLAIHTGYNRFALPSQYTLSPARYFPLSIYFGGGGENVQMIGEYSFAGLGKIGRPRLRFSESGEERMLEVYEHYLGLGLRTVIVAVDQDPVDGFLVFYTRLSIGALFYRELVRGPAQEVLVRGQLHTALKLNVATGMAIKLGYGVHLITEWMPSFLFFRLVDGEHSGYRQNAINLGLNFGFE